MQLPLMKVPCNSVRETFAWRRSIICIFGDTDDYKAYLVEGHRLTFNTFHTLCLNFIMDAFIKPRWPVQNFIHIGR